ncbi:MAG: MFS transporter [Patescibacteria group bacterium]
MESATFSQILKNRGFLNLWINQILVQLSFNALNFTLIFWVFKLTNSITAVSALMFSIYLPAVILGLFTGILVDLMDKKKIIMIIDIFLALSFFSLIFLKDYYIAVLLVAFFVNSLGQFYAPTEASAIPLISKRKELLSANSIFSATLYTTFLLGFGLSGLLIASFGVDFIFKTGGVLLFLAYLLSFMFPQIVVKPDKMGKELILSILKKDYLAIKNIGFFEILKTLRLIKGKLTVLSAILILAGVQMVVGILAVLMSAFLERVLHTKATDASFILIMPLGLGIVIGGLIIGKIGYRFVRRVLVSKAILLSGLLFILMGIIPLSRVLFIGAFLLGLCLVAILVPTQTVLQENTPDQDRGKVFAVLGVAMSLVSLIPVLLAGALADIFGVIPIFIGFGIVTSAIGIFGLNPSLFFKESALPYNIREFLGLGHWRR